VSVLNIQFVNTRPIYTDRGTGADRNVAIFEPIVPDGWYFLGHVAVSTDTSYSVDDPELLRIAPQGLVVQPTEDPTVLCPVTPGQLLWTDADSGGNQDIELYSFVPVVDNDDTGATYATLGLFASVVQRYGTDPTTNPSFAKLRAVRADLLVAGARSTMLAWNDQGSGADGAGLWKDVSYWFITGSHSGGLAPVDAFVAAGDYASPPGATVPAPMLLDTSIIDVSGPYASWMEETPGVQQKRLREVCLPATHDAGAYWLSDELSPSPNPTLQAVLNTLSSVADKINAIPLIGEVIPNPAAWVTEHAIPAIRAISTTTRRTVLQQLVSGIRCLDLRLYYDGNDYHVIHGLKGTHLKSVLEDIACFLEVSGREVVYVTLGHFTGFGTRQYDEFAELLRQTLGKYAYRRETQGSRITNNPFDQTLEQIVTQGSTPPSSRVILVYNDLDGYWLDDPIFWPTYYSPPNNGPTDTKAIYGFYTDTTDPSEMVTTQRANQQQARQYNLPFALYMTLTPGTSDTVLRVVTSLATAIRNVGTAASVVPYTAPIGVALIAVAAGLAVTNSTLPWLSLRDLTQRVNANLSQTVQSNFADYAVNLLYLDFFEDTAPSVVDLAIQLSSR